MVYDMNSDYSLNWKSKRCLLHYCQAPIICIVAGFSIRPRACCIHMHGSDSAKPEHVSSCGLAVAPVGLELEAGTPSDLCLSQNLRCGSVCWAPLMLTEAARRLPLAASSLASRLKPLAWLSSSSCQSLGCSPAHAQMAMYTSKGILQRE